METLELDAMCADIFKILSNPIRISILKLLKERPLCVCEIFDRLDIEQSNTSQHLKLMKKGGFLNSHKDGLKVIYSIKDKSIFDIMDIAERIMIKQAENALERLKGTDK